jgi:oligopeptide/dipeptide ABC transporter ATP-binding protein
MCNSMTDPLLALRGLTVRFPTPGGPLEAVRAVDIDIAPGEVLALVGESGSGKSALARGLLRLNQAPFSRHAAEIGGTARLRTAAGAVDLVTASEASLRDVRARDIAMIFQDALSALNPVMRVGRQVEEAIARRHPKIPAERRRRRATDLLAEVGLDDGTRHARAYPHQLSGGQRQRVMIAIAMAREPALLIADEPTTALDVTVQARVLAQLRALRQRHGMAMLFITHDLSLVPRLADRVAVMYAGRLVEIGPAETVFGAPRHPYTRGLLDSRPGHRRRGAGLTGAAPDPRALPQGCAFAPRCPQAGEDCDLPPAMTDGVRCRRPLTGSLA